MKFTSRLLLLITLLVAAGVHAAQPFASRDVFDLEWVSEPQISPDGKKILYQRNFMDIMTDESTSRLWVMNADGSDNQPLTGKDTAESNASWSPDSEQVIFTSKTEHGSEIFLYWIASDKTARLTQLDGSPKNLAWSPDGQQIAFAMKVAEEAPMLVSAPAKPDDAEWAEPARITTRLKYEQDGSGYIEPGFTQYFVVSRLGGAVRQVSSGEFQHSSAPSWTADGNSLVFSGNRNEDWEHDFANSEVYRLNIASGDVAALTDRNGPDEAPIVSPDGNLVAWLSYEDKVQTYQLPRLHVMRIDGSDKREVLPEFDRQIGGIAWDPASNGLYFQYEDRGDTKIAYTSLRGRQRDIAAGLGGTTIGRPYGGGSFSVADTDLIVYTHVTPYRPAELAVVSSRGSEPEILTGFSTPLLGQRTLGKVEEIWYESSVDGREIQGWYVTPPNYEDGKAYPLVVENHGGPISNYGPRFSPEIQLFAAAGYVVFYPNPRGSTGYGEEFGNLLFNNYPGDDYQDVMDGVDALLETGITAEDRLYVTGGSAGGIMTAWIIGKNQRFRAAAVVKPVMNWISKTLTADNYFQYANYRMPGQPWENIETYMKFSPISLVGNIETPTLVMVGMSDMRTPLSESKQLYGALKIRGIDTALVELPGAPHNIAGRPSQLIAKIEHILAWFAKYPPD